MYVLIYHANVLNVFEKTLLLESIIAVCVHKKREYHRATNRQNDSQQITPWQDYNISTQLSFVSPISFSWKPSVNFITSLWEIKEFYFKNTYVLCRKIIWFLYMYRFFKVNYEFIINKNINFAC